MDLRDIVDSYMRRVPEVEGHCRRCLETRRWDGSVVLMIIDAAFTSIGLNYFKSVVPKVEMVRRDFLRRGVKTLEDFLAISKGELYSIWRNRRSWQVARSVARYLVGLKKEKGLDDRGAFICWARGARIEGWWKDQIGGIKGVGINTFQYLRMMGGIDTVMPDKIVRRVMGEILSKAGIRMPDDDIEFINLVEGIAKDCNCRPIELCWMSWLIQSEGGISRSEKYSEILSKI